VQHCSHKHLKIKLGRLHDQQLTMEQLANQLKLERDEEKKHKKGV
jgi:hypothetical protein